MTYLKYISRRTPIYGIGINDADYSVTSTANGKTAKCPFYVAWNSMFFRCYSEKHHKQYPAYIGYSVAEEWHSFMVFRSWMMTQDWQGKDLDKDIMYPGNKIYSPKACVFISQSLNKLLTNKKSKDRGLPQGVVSEKDTGKYRASIRINNKQKYLGLFATALEANLAYRNAKRIALITIACCEPDPRIKQGLYRHSLLY